MEEKFTFRTNLNIEQIADFVAQTVINHLKDGQRVLWLLPGGSAIKVATLAAKQIAAHDHHNLIITLTDERFGPTGHADSNWRQLQDAGFILSQAQLISVLENQDFLETAVSWSKKLSAALKAADYIIGLFGIGADGHTAGILPNSPAADSSELVCAYDAGNFKRISTTPLTISQVNEAMVFAFGEAKWPALRNLNKDLPLEEQPAQALKNVKKLTIFSDYENSN